MQHQSGYLPTQCVIDGYAQGGFHFANMSHKGSVLVLPTGVYAWAPQNYDEINVSSLALLLDLPQGAIDLLIVGTGAHLQPLLPETRNALAAHHIRHDPMATHVAISTYNILFEEGRRVAAALLAVS